MHRFVTLLLLAATMQGCDAPGEGRKAASGYRFCTPIIAGLEDFKVRHAVYPDSLEQLPIDSVKLGLMPRYIQDIGYHVDSTKSTYELEFRYAGPGMNQCTYTSATAAWQCHGYY